VARLRRLAVGLSPPRARFVSGPVRVRFVVDIVALGQYFGFPSQYPCRIDLYTAYLHRNTTFIRRTSGRSLGTFKESSDGLIDIFTYHTVKNSHRLPVPAYIHVIVRPVPGCRPKLVICKNFLPCGKAKYLLVAAQGECVTYRIVQV
jgi:hypothetical protein